MSQDGSRPRTTRTITFYSVGEDDHPVKMPINTRKYRNLEYLMDDLTATRKFPLQYGVRRLMTAGGRHQIKALDELEHMGSYLCTDRTKGRIRETGSNGSEVGSLELERNESSNGLPQPTVGSVSRATSRNGGSRMSNADNEVNGGSISDEEPIIIGDGKFVATRKISRGFPPEGQHYVWAFTGEKGKQKSSSTRQSSRKRN